MREGSPCSRTTPVWVRSMPSSPPSPSPGGADAMVFADAGFADVPGLPYVSLASEELDTLLR